jgi:hypothetical protein
MIASKFPFVKSFSYVDRKMSIQQALLVLFLNIEKLFFENDIKRVLTTRF